MIVGETRLFRHAETSEDPYTVTDAFLNITQPDGTAYDPDPEEEGANIPVDIDPDAATAAEEHVFSANALIEQGGRWELKWQIAHSGQVLIRPEWYWASWIDVYVIIRELLKATHEQLTDEAIDRQMHLWNLVLTTEYPQIGAYYDLTGADREHYDVALANFAAAALRPIYQSSGGGELQSVQQDDVIYRYGTSQSQATNEVVGEWMDEGWAALRRVAVLKAEYDATRATFEVFRLAGRRRHAESLGYNAGWAPLLTQYHDEVIRASGL
jgi:hypothetical protein